MGVLINEETHEVQFREGAERDGLTLKRPRGGPRSSAGQLRFTRSGAFGALLLLLLLLHQWGIVQTAFGFLAEPFVEGFILASLSDEGHKTREIGFHLLVIDRQLAFDVEDHRAIAGHVEVCLSRRGAKSNSFQALDGHAILDFGKSAGADGEWRQVHRFHFGLGANRVEGLALGQSVGDRLLKGDGRCPRLVGGLGEFVILGDFVPDLVEGRHFTG